MNPRHYQFAVQLAMSHGVSASASVAEILCANIPSAVAAKPANEKEDRSGTDWWVEMANGHRLSVDCKVRKEDYSLRGHDDLALETWSVIESRVVGWTRRVDKRTDYILWLWQDTGRWCLIPFPMLCKVFDEGWVEWAERYGTKRQFTPARGSRRQYHSECIFVPRREVWAAIYRKFGGAPAAAHV